jgi:hypothetical protein
MKIWFMLYYTTGWSIAANLLKMMEDTPDERANALGRVTPHLFYNFFARYSLQIWKYFPKIIEGRQEVVNHVLTMLKRASRDRSQPLQVIQLGFNYNFSLSQLAICSLYIKDLLKKKTLLHLLFTRH